MTAPALVELTRGSITECRHRGAAAIASADGELLSYGDVLSPIFPRSAIKSLQCISVITSGAADRFGFSQKEIALFCASHSATPDHVETASRILAEIGLGEGDLVCGPHLPLGEAAAHALLRANGEPNRCHNNCSGKHSGMLATAVHMSDPTVDYHAADHPVQRRIHSVLEALTGRQLDADVRGTDGCSVPNWAIPLGNLAQVFARFVSGEGLEPDYCAAAKRITEACWAYPEMVAGPDRLDTVLMRRFGGEVFVKTGAEGVYCGGIRSLGIGFAVKIEDGAKRASEHVASAILARFLAGADDLGRPSALTNWRGTKVGEIRSCADFSRALEGIPQA